MADITTIVNGVYKPTYNWGAPSCREWMGCWGLLGLLLIVIFVDHSLIVFLVLGEHVLPILWFSNFPIFDSVELAEIQWFFPKSTQIFLRKIAFVLILSGFQTSSFQQFGANIVYFSLCSLPSFPDRIPCFMVKKYIKSTTFDQTHLILISETWLTPHFSGFWPPRLRSHHGWTCPVGPNRRSWNWAPRPARAISFLGVKINGWAPVMFVNVS